MRYLLIAVIVLFSLVCEAKYTQTCNVSYLTEAGWSKNYEVEVTFMTGSELNTAMNLFNYETFQVYAIVFWSKNLTTVIVTQGSSVCGSETSKTCIKTSYSYMNGYDRDKRKWRICTESNCY